MYVFLQCDEKWQDEHPLPETGKLEHIADMFATWHPINREMIMACDEGSIMQRRIWAFDHDLRWDSDMTGVTIIGQTCCTI